MSEEDVVLSKNEIALITEEGVLHLLIPKKMLDGEEEMPDLGCFLTAIFLRFHEDDDFCDDIAAWWRKEGPKARDRLTKKKRELH